MGRSGQHLVGCGLGILSVVLLVGAAVVQDEREVAGGRKGRQFFMFREHPVFHPPPIPAESTSWLMTNESGLIYDTFLEHQMMGQQMKPNGAQEIDGECYNGDGNLGQCLSFEKCNPMLYLNSVEIGAEGESDTPDKLGSFVNLREDIYELTRNKNCSAVIRAGNSMHGSVCCPAPPPTPDFENSLFLNPNEAQASVYASPQCGVNSVPELHIVNGTITQPGELPWMVAIHGKTGKVTCGGSLLSESIVLTAAHCISTYTTADVQSIKIHIGDWNLKSTSDGIHEVRGVTKIIKHKYFNLQTFVNDIALLKLDRPVQMTNKIQPICLASMDSQLVGSNLLVAGWGRTYYGGPTSPTLRKVEVRVWDNPSCAKVYRNIAPAGVQDSMICAGDKGKDSCVGDSGGPLMQKVGSVYYQVGIVSFGKGCATLPGVYTRLTHFNRWISNNINKYLVD